jgi:hypothetical protein
LLLQIGAFAGGIILVVTLVLNVYSKLDDRIQTLSTTSTRTETKLDDLIARIPPTRAARSRPAAPPVRGRVAQNLLPSNVLCKDANNRAANGGNVIKNCGCNLLDRDAVLQKLPLPVGMCTSRSATKSVQCGGADLTLNRLAFIQHRKSECHWLAIVTKNPAPLQRH